MSNHGPYSNLPEAERRSGGWRCYLLGVAIAFAGVITVASCAACEQYEGFCPQILRK